LQQAVVILNQIQCKQKEKYKIKLKLCMIRGISFAFLIFSVALIATEYQGETKKSLNENWGVLNCRNQLEKNCNIVLSTPITFLLSWLTGQLICLYWLHNPIIKKGHINN
jgi:hypothetical protein